MRALALALVVAAAAGCGTKTCKSNTVLVSLTLDATSASADKLQVTVTVDGVMRSQIIAHVGGVTSGQIEVDFSKGYPSGKQVTVEVQALEGSVVVGSGMGFVTATSGCAGFMLEVMGVNGGGGKDMSMPATGDMAVVAGGGSTDLAVAVVAVVDMTMPPPDFAGCGTVFVSPTGSDANSGCVPTAPKKTINAAVAVATAHDVVICKGSYGENVNPTRAINLRGGYSCSTWSRTATFGYPMFDGVNDSVVTSPLSGQLSLLVSTPGITVEGLKIVGPVGAAMPSTAAQLSATGAVVKDCQIIGGSVTGGTSSNGSYGLDIESAGDDVFHNLIDGGSGSTNNVQATGSIAVYIGGASHVHDNRIQPGTGSNTIAAATGSGAVGIYVATMGALTKSMSAAIEGNTIAGGNGSLNGGGSVGQSTVGIYLNNGAPIAVDVYNNVIDAGSGNNGTIGIWSAGSLGAFSISSNRIFGGKPSAGSAVAIYINAGTVTIVDNEIHGGEPGAGAGVEAIQLNVGSVDVRHNTIHSGRSGTGKGLSPGIGLHLLSNAQAGVKIINNLFVGEGVSTAMLIETCPSSGALNAWEGNMYAFTWVAQYGSAPGDACAAGGSFPSVPVFTTELGTQSPTTSFSANVHLEDNCPSAPPLDATCFALPGCTTAHDTKTAMAGICMNGIFQAYDQATDGSDTLLKSGWQLKTGTPCAVSKTGFDDTGTVTSDWKGTARTKPASIGADEFDGTCS